MSDSCWLMRQCRMCVGWKIWWRHEGKISLFQKAIKPYLMFLKATHRPEQMLYFWKGYCTRTSKMKFLGVWHANTQIQMHKYKNTVSVKVCDFYSSFQGYPTWPYLSSMVWWPDGHKWPLWPYLAIYGHLAIGPSANDMGKWGIPEKSYKNLAQQCQLDGCNAFLPDFLVKKRCFAIFQL